MSKTRVSSAQRQKLLEFMLAHEDLARGRVAGADASRRKSVMLGELASTLNSMGGGATKTPEKWWKSWQDWRSDAKAKALRLKKVRGGTGGGPGPAPLSQMEETLLQFCGVEMVQGVQGVADPLEAEASILLSENDMNAMSFTDNIPFTVDVVVEEDANGSSTRPEESRRATKNNSDQKLNELLERQAAALEQLPPSIDNLATGLQGIAAALNNIAKALEQQQLAIINPGDL